jgi:hypothetical protein
MEPRLINYCQCQSDELDVDVESDISNPSLSVSDELDEESEPVASLDESKCG